MNRQTFQRFALSLTLVSLVALITSTAPAGKPTKPGGGGGGGGSTPTSEIYFEFDTVGTAADGVYVMFGDGSGKTQVLPDFDPSLIPVPSSGVYAGSRWWLYIGQVAATGKDELFALRNDGTTVQLTQSADGILYPFSLVQWSNDGADTFVSIVAFDKRDPSTPAYHLFRLPIIGDIDFMVQAGALPVGPADFESVVFPFGDGATPWEWSWSNLPNTLAYISHDSSGSTLWVRDLPTTPGGTPADTALVSLPAMSSPAWSPDGSRLAFHTANTSAWGGLWTVNPDGSNLVQLLTNSGVTFYGTGVWSPDSANLAFSKLKDNIDFRKRQISISRIPAGGGRATELTDDLPASDIKFPLRWLPLP